MIKTANDCSGVSSAATGFSKSPSSSKASNFKLSITDH